MDNPPSDATSDSFPKISVVVPAYNTEKYLGECVDSVLIQTFKDFELILVDDGSPDNAGKLCDEFTKLDPRVRVFHKENGGVTSARRLGVEKANAEWICFVDSDDLLTENALEDLFSVTEKFGDEVDLIEGSHVRFRKNPKTGTHEFFDEFHVPQYVVVNGIEYARETVKPVGGAFFCATCAKIIRKHLFEKTHALDLPKWVFAREDTLMDLLLATKTRIAIRVPQFVYEYRITEFSTFSREENRARINSIDYNLSLFNLLKDLYADLDENWQKVAKHFLIGASEVRIAIRHCDLSLLDNPKNKELLKIQKEEFPELPTKLFVARYSFPWKFLPNSAFKVIFKIVKEACRMFE